MDDRKDRIVIRFDEDTGRYRGAQPRESTVVAPATTVSPTRLSPRARRMQADANSMRKAFARFPVIQLLLAQGVPPDLYRVQYNVLGLARGANGQPIQRSQHVVDIQLTAEYPRQAPKCKILTPIFHPNFDPTVICVGDHWTAGESLVDLVVRVGEMIAYQAYNIKSPLDGEAAMWTDLNRNRLPIDSRTLMPPER